MGDRTVLADHPQEAGIIHDRRRAGHRIVATSGAGRSSRGKPSAHWRLTERRRECRPPRSLRRPGSANSRRMPVCGDVLPERGIDDPLRPRGAHPPPASPLHRPCGWPALGLARGKRIASPAPRPVPRPCGAFRWRGALGRDAERRWAEQTRRSLGQSLGTREGKPAWPMPDPRAPSRPPAALRPGRIGPATALGPTGGRSPDYPPAHSQTIIGTPRGLMPGPPLPRSPGRQAVGAWGRNEGTRPTRPSVVGPWTRNQTFYMRRAQVQASCAGLRQRSRGRPSNPGERPRPEPPASS